MKNSRHTAYRYTLVWALLFLWGFAVRAQQLSFDFYAGRFSAPAHPDLRYTPDNDLHGQKNALLRPGAIQTFYQQLNESHYKPLLQALAAYREKYDLDDWLYYQLIRKTAGELCAKSANYPLYTLYKWFLMCKSGYDARLALGDDQIIFYVRNDEDIRDIPFFMLDEQKYMCLNAHDYKEMFRISDAYKPVNIVVPEAKAAFSYKIKQLPDFKSYDFEEKEIAFNYKKKTYHFDVKVNKAIDSIFMNYPGVDFETYFNIPLSRETYQSLIPMLKQNMAGMPLKKGVDFLMRFTRYAFLYKTDEMNFGKEKRLSPEQTLLSTYSDCDDRVALLFFLIKEIYNLPTIAMLYPTHIVIAVDLDQDSKKTNKDGILYDGKHYTVCEPTPQQKDLKLGELSERLKNQQYQVVYHYEPAAKGH